MSREHLIEFVKMHGAGNDFVVIDNRSRSFTDLELSTLARQWCPRRIGIGADGLLALAAPQSDAHDYRMRYFNADGSRATMCGNGARCLARFARMVGLGKERVAFESDAGIYRARVPDDPEAPVRLYVPPPQEFSSEFDLQDRGTDLTEALHYIWTGTQHVVCFVDDVDRTPVETWGPAIRHDEALAPAGANANFVQVLDAEKGTPTIRVRTFEKGVEAETQACGTGALAAAVVTRLLNRVERSPIAVQMPGGRLTVGFKQAEGAITDLYLEGPVVTVFRGTVEASIDGV